MDQYAADSYDIITGGKYLGWFDYQDNSPADYIIKASKWLWQKLFGSYAWEYEET